MNVIKKQKELLFFVCMFINVIPAKGMWFSSIESAQKGREKITEPSFYQKFISLLGKYFSKESDIKTSQIQIPKKSDVKAPQIRIPDFLKYEMRYGPEERLEFKKELKLHSVEGKDGIIRAPREVLDQSKVINSMLQDLDDLTQHSPQPIDLKKFAISTIGNVLNSVSAVQFNKISSLEEEIKTRSLAQLINEANLIEEYDFPKKVSNVYKKAFEKHISEGTTVNTGLIEKIVPDLLKQWSDAFIKEFFRELSFFLIQKNISKTEKYIYWPGEGTYINLTFNNNATQLAAGRSGFTLAYLTTTDKCALFDVLEDKMLFIKGIGNVKAIAFDPLNENNLIIVMLDTRSRNNKPVVYDITTKIFIPLSLPGTISPHEITTLAFSPTGDYLIFRLKLGDHDTLCLVNRSSGNHEFLNYDKYLGINKIIFSKDGKRFIAASEKYLSVWDMQTKSKIFEYTWSENVVNPIYSIDINYSGNKILIGHRVKYEFVGFGGMRIDDLEHSIRLFDITDPTNPIIRDVVERKKINDKCAALWLDYENEALIWDNFGGIEHIALDDKGEILKKQVVRKQEYLMTYTPFVMSNNEYRLAAAGIAPKTTENHYIYLWNVLNRDEKESLIKKYSHEQRCLLYSIVLQSKKGKKSIMMENSHEKERFNTLNEIVKSFLLERFINVSSHN